MKPNQLGPKTMFLNPGLTTFTSADFAAIDGDAGSNTIYPYAYSAVVRSDYDSRKFGSTTTNVDLVATKRVALGLFLSPESRECNLLFQLSGSVHYWFNGTSPIAGGFFFFGRKKTDNTVTSSKAATSNELDSWIVLPVNFQYEYSAGLMNASIEKELFALNDPGKYCYCFGFAFDNFSVSNPLNTKFHCDLSFRKYNSEISAFMPSR